MDHLTHQQLLDLFHGTLSSEETEQAELHLSSCPPCEEAYNQIMKTGSLPESSCQQRYLNDLKCVICQNKTFQTRKALLNTRLATFMDLDWANRYATCYVCTQCGYIHWFLK